MSPEAEASAAEAASASASEPVEPSDGRRVVVITGASSGIGAAAAAELARRGDRVVVVGRNPARTAAVAEGIGADAFLADFDRLDDVRALAGALLGRFERIDVLLNNAGGLLPKRAVTADGHERTIQSNLIAPFLLTELLAPRLSETAAATGVSGRVISTASMANLWGRIRLDDLDYDARSWRGGWPAYGSAKLGVILWTRALAERLIGTGVDAYAVHPGTVVTGFGADTGIVKLGNRIAGSKWGLSPEKGAAPLVQLATDAALGAPSGSYFSRFKVNGAVSRQAKDAQLGRELWDVLAEATAQA